MTEYWKSNAMHWCDICKCWMNDTKAARMNHERGAQHQAKLATKLRDMAKKADDEVKAKSANEAAMSKIEAAARKQYEQDRKAAEEARKAAEEAAGSWTWDAGCSYYYNAAHRWYYDPKTQWYYGGEPTPEWSQSPPLPADSMFGVAPHEGGPVPQGAAGSAAATGASGGGASGSGRPEGLPVVTKTIQRVVAVPKHPLADLGGHRAPTTGRVGGAMGAGMVVESGGADPGAKRKREDQLKGAGAGSKGGAAKGAVSAEEAEALARREAARQRVAQRTAAGFGYL
ncbi:hypothetical protein PLESTB_000075900 [Pleodorina starrii]|uniref:U1-type domain-containing protein n=1 Tax=Pleodorina starrii TaxID=330485 RepID=A0A9W6EXG8_9CHLO|nr:hypothetical protein PLESTM_000071500 [Pleodorina starrii]GLC48255.1 hypothetical protein PLESTB_000075900 [Pleodorina starrii]GLC66544.1 hypothetical protein PLESTF_000442100 [Pleodorina starrii]